VVESIVGLLNVRSFFGKEKYKLPLTNLRWKTNHRLSEKRLSDFSKGRYCAIKA
jgi:hypothetical protein